MRRPSCRRFARALDRQHDGLDTDTDRRFIRSHRETCAECRAHEAALGAALNFLQHEEIRYEGEDEFERAVVRDWRLEKEARKALRYYAPTALGAAVAAMALLAILQILTNSARMQPIDLRGHEARRIERNLIVLPDFEVVESSTR